MNIISNGKLRRCAIGVVSVIAARAPQPALPTLLQCCSRLAVPAACDTCGVTASSKWTNNANARCVALQRSGIGSQIHVLGLVLAVAMDLDRILLLDTDVHDALFTDDDYCGAVGVPGICAAARFARHSPAPACRRAC